jgi:hypothetical protein
MLVIDTPFYECPSPGAWRGVEGLLLGVEVDGARDPAQLLADRPAPPAPLRTGRQGRDS